MAFIMRPFSMGYRSPLQQAFAVFVLNLFRVRLSTILFGLFAVHLAAPQVFGLGVLPGQEYLVGVACSVAAFNVGRALFSAFPLVVGSLFWAGIFLVTSGYLATASRPVQLKTPVIQKAATAPETPVGFEAF